MQEEFKEFDLQMRSMLEDAEVKPSRRVWKGISARLDDDALRNTGRYGRMKWAGAALAFAAALGAGLFFTGTHSAEIQPQEVSPVAQAVLPEEPAGASATEAATETAETSEPQSIAIPADSYLTQSLAAGRDDNTESVADNDKAETAVDDQASNGEGTAAVETAGGGRPSAEAEDGDDAFALLEAEDARKARRSGRTALYLKGAVGGNDSDVRVSRPYASMAPGYGTSGISELSTSTYGVPVTLGLGVRFHIAGRLSFGTGIDYSLLTRTFTGKYTEFASDGSIVRSEAGNVSHTLQYIGVPVGLYYDVLNYDKVKFYVYGLGEAEYCISNRYVLYSSPDISCSDRVEKLQYSVGLGLGLEFSLNRTLGLYLDPGLRYYFPCDQPKSVRTDKPVSVSFDAGLRFKF